MRKIASSTILAFVFLFLNPNVIFAAEKLESFWLGSLPRIVEQLPEMHSANIQIQAWGESALFNFFNKTEIIKFLCHFHSSNSYYHCSREQIDFQPPENVKTILEMSSQSLSELIETVGLSEVLPSDPVWPWVIGAIAAYYVSKKVINYWVNKSFESKPHSHEFTLLSKSELESSINSQLEMVRTHTQDLGEIFETDLKLNFLEREKIRTMLGERIRSLNKKVIDELLGSYCSTCKTVHLPQQSHYLSGLSQSQFFISSSDNDRPSFTEQFMVQLKHNEVENIESAPNEPKNLIQKSVVLKAAKALIIDIHRELIQPIPKVFRYARRLLSDKEHFNQLNSYAQTKYSTSVGESNFSTGIAIASSLITIKVLGETLESMIVGPYHVFCQISDVAAVTTGLVFLTTYHSFRQPVKLRQPRLLISKRFWSLMFEKLKNPTLNGRLAASKKDKNFPESESLILELAKLKQEIQQWIWQMRSDGILTPKKSNSLARKLGQISKQKEDIIFSVKINEEYSSSELLVLVNKLKQVYKEYESLFEEIMTEYKNTLSLKSKEIANINLCAGFL